jgi:hypothetical protein
MIYIPEAIPFEVTVSQKSAEINGRSFGGSLVPRARLSRLDDTLAGAVRTDIEGHIE